MRDSGEGRGVRMVEGYAPWLVEAIRVRLGYDPDDDTHDQEVLEYLQSGEKLSKSKHMS